MGMVGRPLGGYVKTPKIMRPVRRPVMNPPPAVLTDEVGNQNMGPMKKKAKPPGGQPLVAPLPKPPGGQPLVAPSPAMSPRRQRLEDTYQRINAQIDGVPAPQREDPRDMVRAGKIRGGGGPR